jgi:FMN phosphatase YigB (HAD superfamily)
MESRPSSLRPLPDSVIRARPLSNLSPVQAIVTDLGQVLLRFDHEPCWEKILAACDHPRARELFRGVYRESRLGCGHTEPEAFFERAAAAMGLRLSYPEFCRAWSDMFWEDQEAIELIAGAPVSHRLILSNTNAIHWNWIRERHAALLARFDGCLVSHECGVEKPAPEIYQMAILRTNLPAEAHLFIDDLVENVEGARAVGMLAVLHTDAAALREEFRRLGL